MFGVLALRGALPAEAQEAQAMTPTLADLALCPSLIDQLDGPTCGDVLIEASALVVRLGRRLAMSRVIVSEREPEGETTDLAGASKILGIGRSTLGKLVREDVAYRRLLVRMGRRRLVFSVAACREFVRRRTGALAPAPLGPGGVA